MTLDHIHKCFSLVVLVSSHDLAALALMAFNDHRIWRVAGV